MAGRCRPICARCSAGINGASPSSMPSASSSRASAGPRIRPRSPLTADRWSWLLAAGLWEAVAGARVGGRPAPALGAPAGGERAQSRTGAPRLCRTFGPLGHAGAPTPSARQIAGTAAGAVSRPRPALSGAAPWPTARRLTAIPCPSSPAPDPPDLRQEESLCPNLEPVSKLRDRRIRPGGVPCSRPSWDGLHACTFVGLGSGWSGAR